MNHKPCREAIEKARLVNTGCKRSKETRELLSKVRKRNIEKTSNTVRKSPGRSKEVPYKGVYKKGNKYQVRINYNGKFLNLGTFDDMELAAKNYDYHCLVLYGEECFRNFSDIDYRDFVPKKNPVISSKDFAIVNVIYNPSINKEPSE